MVEGLGFKSVLRTPSRRPTVAFWQADNLNNADSKVAMSDSRKSMLCVVWMTVSGAHSTTRWHGFHGMAFMACPAILVTAVALGHHQQG